MTIYPQSSLLRAKLKNGAYFLVAGVLFCALAWGIFSTAFEGEKIAGPTEEQLTDDIAASLGAVGVNSSAVPSSGQDGEDSQLPFEVSEDQDRSSIKDPAVQQASNESSPGPLFADPINGFEPSGSTNRRPSTRESAARSASGRNAVQATKKPAWLTGTIEFE
jgi:hypothetical protein